MNFHFRHTFQVQITQHTLDWSYQTPVPAIILIVSMRNDTKTLSEPLTIWQVDAILCYCQSSLELVAIVPVNRQLINLRHSVMEKWLYCHTHFWLQ